MNKKLKERRNKCSKRSMKVQLPVLGNYDRPTGQKTNPPTDPPTRRRTQGFIGKLHFHKVAVDAGATPGAARPCRRQLGRHYGLQRQGHPGRGGADRAAAAAGVHGQQPSWAGAGQLTRYLMHLKRCKLSKG